LAKLGPHRHSLDGEWLLGGSGRWRRDDQAGIGVVDSARSTILAGVGGGGFSEPAVIVADGPAARTTKMLMS